jgi:hypothetical protein
MESGASDGLEPAAFGVTGRRESISSDFGNGD